jgi:hypothetical protein
VGLLIGYDLGRLEPRTRQALDHILAAIQTWAGTVESITVQTGCVVLWAGTGTPTGYLRCDGTAYDRTVYAALFAKIGIIHGAGNGTTTFNVPTHAALGLSNYVIKT